jgi:uncharacterized membrane-anchored protein YhcB (DUF1043 family)
MNKKLAIILGSIIGVIVLAVIIIFGANQVQQMQVHNKEVAAKEKEAAIEKKREKVFDKTFDQFITDATASAALSESMGGTYHDVWSKTIDNGSVTISGKKYTDFSKAVSAQSDKFETNGFVDDVEKGYNDSKETYDKLSKNVTYKNQERFNQAKNLYDSLGKFYSLSSSPSGSLNSFTEDFNQLDSDIAAALKAIQ